MKRRSVFPRLLSLRLVWVAAPMLTLQMACEPAPLDDPQPYEGVALLPACTGDNDGVIDADELPFAPGIVARYRIAEGAIDVDTRGRVEDDVVVWDLSTPDPESEPLAELAARSAVGWWFDGKFEGADVVGPLDPAGELVTPIDVTEEGVHLLGAASATADPSAGRTLVVYDQPITLYPFPLAEGVRVTTTATASDAELIGLPTALTDTYDVEVTGRGTLRLPHMVLHNTLRVTLRFARTLIVGDARQVTHVFVHECLGEVARIVSPAGTLGDVIDDEFTTAASVWRMSL
jgi:hypothetical protein